MGKPFYYGGQAVLEGVMMRGRRNIAIAVRRPNGEVATFIQPLGALSTGRLREIPAVRGLLVLGETLYLGTRALLYSANVALEEEEKAPSSALIWVMLTISILFAVGVFFLGPTLLMRWLDPYLDSSLLSNLVEGLIRIGLFVAYVGAIGLAPDIRRVFAYHGAEHKAVNAYEAGSPMEVAEVRKYSTAHARCGTGFLLVVLVLAIIIFAFLGTPPMWLRLLSRLALLPVIAGLGYELIRLGARYGGNKVVRAILAPSLVLQALTTREPDDSQLEIAISALRRVIDADAPLAEAGESPAAAAG